MERASRRKYHYIYKITCNVTNRYYIGMHSTDKLEDGYMGSGKRLWFSINYHGKDNHLKEILEFLPDRISLKEREKELVNKELLIDKLCMNLKEGGEGGFKDREHMLKCSTAGGKVHSNRLKNDEKYSEKHSKTASKTFANTHKEGKIKYDNFIGKKHNEDGFTTKGLQWWNDGHFNKMHKGRPGEGWVRGRVPLISDEERKKQLNKKCREYYYKNREKILEQKRKNLSNG
jgi:hypothetical protein